MLALWKADRKPIENLQPVPARFVNNLRGSGLLWWCVMVTPYYQDDLITLYLADCLPAMREMPDKAFDLAIVDPPYFSGPDKLGYYGEVISNTKVKRQSYKIAGNWSIPSEEYFKQLLRISVHQIIWGINYFSIKNLGPGRIVWDKANDKSSFSDGEIAYCSIIDTVRFIRLMWNGMIQCDMKNKEVRIHPTQKPVALYRWLLKNYAKPGDSILDTHLGSGSIAIACHDLGFTLTAYEIDEEYLSTAVDRIKRYLRQPKMFKPDNSPHEQESFI